MLIVQDFLFTSLMLFQQLTCSKSANIKLQQVCMIFSDLLQLDEVNILAATCGQLQQACKIHTSAARDEVECRNFLFFPRYGVFCDLLQYTRTVKRNLFVLYIK